MPKTYGRDVRLRAVALAEVRSIPVASKELGVPIDTITRWVEEEPQTPALERAVNLALSELTARIADGSMSSRDLTVAYGVTRDKWARYGRTELQPSSGSAIAAHDAFADWLVDTTPIESEAALEATVAAIRAVTSDLLLRRANAEADPYGPPSPHRLAILGWFSGRPEVEAGDVLEWAQAQVAEAIETHGSITAWHAFQQAEDAAEEARRHAAAAAIEARAAVLNAESRQAALDSETRALLAAAEAFLQQPPPDRSYSDD